MKQVKEYTSEELQEVGRKSLQSELNILANRGVKLQARLQNASPKELEAIGRKTVEQRLIASEKEKVRRGVMNQLWEAYKRGEVRLP